MSNFDLYNELANAKIRGVIHPIGYILMAPASHGLRAFYVMG